MNLKLVIWSLTVTIFLVFETEVFKYMVLCLALGRLITFLTLPPAPPTPPPLSATFLDLLLQLSILLFYSALSDPPPPMLNICTPTDQSWLTHPLRWTPTDQILHPSTFKLIPPHHPLFFIFQLILHTSTVLSIIRYMSRIQ